MAEKKENEKEPRFIIKNGIRWVNPNYEIGPNDEPNFELGEDFDIPPHKDLKTEEEMEDWLELIKKFSAQSFVKGHKGTNVDKAIKDIMHGEMYKKASQGKEKVKCPLCSEQVRENHFIKHELIFTRGCIYCDCYLHPNDFKNYRTHIEQYHSDELKKSASN